MMQLNTFVGILPNRNIRIGRTPGKIHGSLAFVLTQITRPVQGRLKATGTGLLKVNPEPSPHPACSAFSWLKYNS